MKYKELKKIKKLAERSFASGISLGAGLFILFQTVRVAMGWRFMTQIDFIILIFGLCLLTAGVALGVHVIDIFWEFEKEMEEEG